MILVLFARRVNDIGKIDLIRCIRNDADWTPLHLHSMLSNPNGIEQVGCGDRPRGRKQYQTKTERDEAEAFARSHRLSIANAFERKLVRKDVVEELTRLFEARMTDP